MTTRPELIADRAIGRACANGHAGTARSALALGIGVQRDSRPIALNVNVNTTGCAYVRACVRVRADGPIV